MSKIYWLIVIIFCFSALSFIGIGVDNLDHMKDIYKKALDAGTDAAAEYDYYEDEAYLRNIATGFGTGLQHKGNIKIKPDEALEWFYRVFFKNVSLEYNTEAQDKLKQYIPMKALVLFDRIMIANQRDEWIIDKPYQIEVSGVTYQFTLSDQVYNVSTGEWKRDSDCGISTERRKALVSQFVMEELTSFLNSRENYESGNYYSVNISLNDIDPRTDDVDGVNIIVMTEGMPLPSMNPWNASRLFAFSLGGSEITRLE